MAASRKSQLSKTQTVLLQQFFFFLVFDSSLQQCFPFYRISIDQHSEVHVLFSSLLNLPNLTDAEPKHLSTFTGQAP